MLKNTTFLSYNRVLNYMQVMNGKYKKVYRVYTVFKISFQTQLA